MTPMQARTDLTRVKALPTAAGQSGRIGGYLVVWGDDARRDLQGEFFTPRTDLCPDWYDRRPVLYHHGLDGDLKAAVIGTIEALQADDTGLWAEAQLDLHQQYVQTILGLIERGVLNWSSGSLAHLVQVADDGEILRWPLVEGSLTPTPAEPRRTDVQTIKSAYTQLGLNPDRLLAASHLTDPQNHHLKNNHGDTITMIQHEHTTGRKRLPFAADAASDTAAVPIPRPGTRISVGSEFDGLKAADLLHGYMLLRATRNFRGVSERYANALAYKVRREGLSAIKADTLSHTAQEDYGAEWVPDLWSRQIWQIARNDNVVLPLFRAVEMPSDPFVLPVEGTDPSVYFVPETTAPS